MKTDFYIPIEIKKKPPFLAKNYILKTDEIKILLNNLNIDYNKIFTFEEQDILVSNIKDSLGNEEYLKLLNTNDMIIQDLLEQLENFLQDASLALSLYLSTINHIEKIPVMDKLPTKYIGKIPMIDYTIKIPKIFAHSYLDALVKISNTIRLMTNEYKTPYIEKSTRNEIESIYKDFNKVFPKIWDVRNSWQHIEDRMRGKDKYEKKLNSEMLVLSSLFGNKLSYTISGGEIHSIIIDQDSLFLANHFVQKVWNCFDWLEGSKM